MKKIQFNFQLLYCKCCDGESNRKRGLGILYTSVILQLIFPGQQGKRSHIHSIWFYFDRVKWITKTTVHTYLKRQESTPWAIALSALYTRCLLFNGSSYLGNENEIRRPHFPIEQTCLSDEANGYIAVLSHQQLEIKKKICLSGKKSSKSI